MLYSMRRTLMFESMPRTIENEVTKVLYGIRRTLIFESRLRKIENEVSKSAVLCSRDSHFREEAPHFCK